MRALCILAACVGAHLSVFAQEVAKTKKRTVAVLEFQSTGGLQKSETATLTNRFRNILVRTKAFNVLEREQMTEILKEQDFALGDQCNTEECVVEVGKLLNVELMIAGDIGKVGTRYTIDLRFVEVSTGKIIQTEYQDYKGETEGLLDVMQRIAEQFAEKERKNLASKGQPVKEVKSEKISDGSKKGSKMWLYIGGAAVAGGGAFLLLSKKSGGSGSSGIPNADFPN